MNLIKATLRNRSINDSLNSILRIHISGLSLQSFHDEHLKKCVIYWFNTQNCRLSQRKRKLYKKRERRQNDLILEFLTHHQAPRALPIYLHQKMKL